MFSNTVYFKYVFILVSIFTLNKPTQPTMFEQCYLLLEGRKEKKPELGYAFQDKLTGWTRYFIQVVAKCVVW